VNDNRRSRDRSNAENNIKYQFLPIEYWERSEACKSAKLDHLDRLDELCDREFLVLNTLLWNRDTAMEKNMFPYDTPKGIEHYTLWCVNDMTHYQICSFVEKYLRKRMPHVRRWNYDDNSGERSFQLFHVHVFIETIPYSYNSDPNRSYSPVRSDAAVDNIELQARCTIVDN